jgi:ubiquinone biosynthesis protein
VRSELDFTAEARNLDHFGAFFSQNETVQIPLAYRDHTTARLLTESRLQGIPLSRPEEIQQAGGDIHRLIRNGMDAYLQMVFELRRFHSDPHPGNLLAMDGDSIGFVDFGRVNALSERNLDRLADCFLGFAQNDSAELTEAILRLVDTGAHTDTQSLERDLESMMDRYAEADVASSTGPSVIFEMLEIMRQHQLRLPSQYAMLLQTLAVLQGVVLTLDPETKLLKMMEPYVERVTVQRYTPERVRRALLRHARQCGRAAALVPGALENVLQRVATAELGVKVNVAANEEGLDRAEAVANRFSLTLLLSAMAIALALVAGRSQPGWMGFATHALLFLVFFVGVWHFTSILAAEGRSKRRKQDTRRR